MKKKRVMVAMSGGVDSSVAALLLQEAGHEVSGVHMQLHDNVSPDSESVAADLEDTCRMLGIPLYQLDFRSTFEKEVIGYF
jgi:tRNA-specific 2-thiouridylase